MKENERTASRQGANLRTYIGLVAKKTKKYVFLKSSKEIKREKSAPINPPIKAKSKKKGAK